MGALGPFQTPTHVGCSYFVTLVDDRSRYTWVYLIKHKSDVLLIILRFFKLIETQFSKVIKTFRTYNAHELGFKEFLASIGTIHQFSCVYVPQQNSIMEQSTDIFSMLHKRIDVSVKSSYSFLDRMHSDRNTLD